MKGFAFQVFIGSIAIFMVVIVMFTLGPVYTDNVAPIMLNISNITAVDNTIEFGQIGVILIGWIAIIGIIIWMVIASQKEEYDSGVYVID